MGYMVIIDAWEEIGYMVTIYVSEMECILRINGIYGDY